MATISIFSIRLGRLLLTCERDMAAGYVLIVNGVRSPLTVDAAAALGGRRLTIEWRARKAVDGRMKPGMLFGLQLTETRLTIGVAASGLDVYCEVGEERVHLGEEDLQGLMFALHRLAADVSTVQQAVVERQVGAEVPPAALRRGFAIRIPGGDGEWM
jgi:hypothetical protein